MIIECYINSIKNKKTIAKNFLGHSELPLIRNNSSEEITNPNPVSTLGTSQISLMKMCIPKVIERPNITSRTGIENLSKLISSESNFSSRQKHSKIKTTTIIQRAIPVTEPTGCINKLQILRKIYFVLTRTFDKVIPLVMETVSVICNIFSASIVLNIDVANVPNNQDISPKKFLVSFSLCFSKTKVIAKISHGCIKI